MNFITSLLKINWSVVPAVIFLLISSPVKLYAQPAAYSGSVVVELFTSQGDINSIDADKILRDVIAEAAKNNRPVYAIAMHVDFWNRFGWKDPFSSFKYTTRLQNYSSVFGEKETYTPRFVINGKPIGSNTDAKTISQFIQKELLVKTPFSPTFTYQVFDDTLDISYRIHGNVEKNKSGSESYINIVITENGLSTKVTKGDNAGKTLLNDAVSRLFYTTDLKTENGVIRVPLKGVKPGKNKNIIFFIQDKKQKSVKGATSAGFQ